MIRGIILFSLFFRHRRPSLHPLADVLPEAGGQVHRRRFSPYELKFSPPLPIILGMDDLTVSLDRHFLLWFAEYGARCWVVLPNGQMVPTVDDTTRERLLAEYFERYISS